MRLAEKRIRQAEYRRRRAAGLCCYSSCRKRGEQGRSACRRHLRYAARVAAEIRSRRIAEGLCIQCGKRPQFWGVRCIICRQLTTRAPLPRSALKAIRLHRKAEAQREAKQIKENTQAAARSILANGEVSGKAGQALRLYVGLDGRPWRTYEQVAKLMNLTRERVRQLLLTSKITLETELAGKVPWRPVTKDAEHTTEYLGVRLDSQRGRFAIRQKRIDSE